MREQGARKGNRSEQNACATGIEIVCETSLRRDPAVAETEVVAVAETEAQPPDPPQTDDIMELMLINASKGLIRGMTLIRGRERPGAMMTTGSRLRSGSGDCNRCTR